jgi:hypothetical protein
MIWSRKPVRDKDNRSVGEQRKLFRGGEFDLICTVAELDSDIESGELRGAKIGTALSGLEHASWYLLVRCFDGSDENVGSERHPIGGRSLSRG